MRLGFLVTETRACAFCGFGNGKLLRGRSSRFYRARGGTSVHGRVLWESNSIYHISEYHVQSGICYSLERGDKYRQRVCANHGSYSQSCDEERSERLYFKALSGASGSEMSLETSIAWVFSLRTGEQCNVEEG